MHTGNFYAIWNIIIIFMLALLVWYIPYELAFGDSNEEKNLDEMNAFEILTIFIFAFDICINFNLS